MECYLQAKQIPSEWDSVCGDNYAAKRDFLSRMEVANSFESRYYVFRSSSGKIDSIVITYVNPYQNIFCMTPFTFQVKVTFIHVPLSITRPGFVMGKETEREVIHFITSIKGYVIILNTTRDFGVPSFSRGRICFGMRMELRWESFDGFMSDLRSHYRYRYKRALKKGRRLSFDLLDDTSAVDDDLYRLYENVHGKSHIKIEKLTIGMFTLPASKIIVANLDNKPIGFIQMIENRKELVFAFVGLDYRYTSRYDVYHNLLLKMVTYGIEHGFDFLELGQTAETTKLRLGADYYELYMMMRHSNPFMNLLVRGMLPLIQYRPVRSRYNVFKSNGNHV